MSREQLEFLEAQIAKLDGKIEFSTGGQPNLRPSELAAELGVAVAPSTILRWVVRYTDEFVNRWAPFELPVGRSWRADETYIKVRGGWMFLYRAVDKEGRTVASYLSKPAIRQRLAPFFGGL